MSEVVLLHPNTAMDADAGGLLAHPDRRGSSPTLGRTTDHPDQKFNAFW